MSQDKHAMRHCTCDAVQDKPIKLLRRPNLAQVASHVTTHLLLPTSCREFSGLARWSHILRDSSSLQRPAGLAKISLSRALYEQLGFDEQAAGHSRQSAGDLPCLKRLTCVTRRLVQRTKCT